MPRWLLIPVLRAALLAALVAPPAFAHRLHGEAHEPAAATAEALPDAWEQAPAAAVRSLVRQYHRTGDDRLLARGREALGSALEAPNPPPALLLAGAWLAQAQHRFDLAEAHLRRVTALQPRHAEAWLLRASVALVRGETGAAGEHCKATAFAVPAAITAACLARVAAHGPADAPGADAATLDRTYRRLARLAAVAPPADPELLGWLHGVLADLALRSGDYPTAGEHFRTALRLAPSVSLQAGYADTLLGRGEPHRVLELIERDSPAPALAIRRLVAHNLLLDSSGRGDPRRQQQEEVNETFRQWIAEGEMQHAREMAWFYLDLRPDPQLAYDLARRNFSVQREPEDHALLCEAAARAGIDDGACPSATAQQCGRGARSGVWPLTASTTSNC